MEREIVKDKNSSVIAAMNLNEINLDEGSCAAWSETYYGEQTYSEEQLLKLAKRFHNTKRTYLLVDPLQGKHIPVSPNECLRMLRTLGTMLSDEFPSAKLVVGFAETATAVGAAVAECMGRDCRYYQTTREDVEGVDSWVEFLEEHSHAAEQKLAADKFAADLDATDTVIFVDDELSTGKTLNNMIDRLITFFPQLANKHIVAASIINRMSDENIAAFAKRGIACRQLLKLENINYTEVVAPMVIRGASELPEINTADTLSAVNFIRAEDYASPRTGVRIGEYIENILTRHDRVISNDKRMIPSGRRLAVIGTEECMYPGLIIAEQYENSGAYASVRFHATTRSPIGICEDEDYPVTNGYKLKSFYEKDRQTFLYDLAEYDSVLIVTDSAPENMEAVQELAGLFRYYGCSEVIVERV